VSAYLDKQNLQDDLKTILKALSVFTVKKHHSDLNDVAEVIKKLDGILIEKQIQSIDNEKLQEVLQRYKYKQMVHRRNKHRYA